MGNNLLKQYYIEVFKKDFDPEFENLTETQKKYLQNSSQYALWKLRIACKKLSEEVEPIVKKINLLLNKLFKIKRWQFWK